MRIAGPTAQEPADGPFEFREARRCLVGGALRLGPCAACGVELVGEVFGVVADALVELREFGAQLVEWPLAELARGAAAALCVGAVRWRTGRDVVDAVESEVLVVAAAHGGVEAFDGSSLVAKFGGLVGRDVGAVELAFGWGVDEEQLGGLSGAGEGGVGPVAGEVVGVPHDAGPLHGAALDGVRGQGVGVLEVFGHVGGVEGALGAGVGAHEDVLLGRVDGDDGAAGAVVDAAQAVVATRDDPVAHGELLARRRGRSPPADRRGAARRGRAR